MQNINPVFTVCLLAFRLHPTILVSGFLLLVSLSSSAQLAFPGAEGYGAFASGGRGGTVYHVTNLKDSGDGSFRDAVSKPNRTVVFDVGGLINAKSRISFASNLTVAGQTAPGEGVVVFGYGITLSKQQNVIIRYMRFRGSIDMPRGMCTLTADSAKNMIFDHISIGWGRWDNLHIQASTDITFQYCMIGESIDPQRFGALLERPSNLTIHHTLWIDNQSRNPKAKADIEYINNVVYNWGVSGFVGGHSAADHHQDLINNYFVAGPNSSDNYLSMFTATDHVYQSGNYADLDKDGKLNGTLVSEETFKAEKADIVAKRQNVSPVPVTIHSAVQAFQLVMDKAGSSIKRDSIDRRIIGYLRSLGTEGKIFRTETEAGGQNKLPEIKAETDTDRDGMSDSWEIKNKLDAKNSEDGNRIQKGSLYSNLERYLNEFAN